MIVIGTDMVTTPFSDDCTNQLTVRSYFGRIIHNFGTNGQIEVYEEPFWSNFDARSNFETTVQIS